MDADAADERYRVVAGALRLVDAERCTWSFTVQNVVALLLLSLSPMIPGASEVFGSLTTPRMLVIVTPAVVMTMLGSVIYRRSVPGSLAYRGCEALQTFLQYCVNVASVFESQLTWPVLWILCPFSSVFFAVTRPHEPRRMTATVLGAHAALAIAYVVRGGGARGVGFGDELPRAWLAVGVGLVSWLLYVAIAKGRRNDADLEAERRVAERRLSEARLDEARRAVARTLTSRIGREIERLSAEADATTHAADARASLDAVANPAPSSGDPVALGELVVRIDAKCRRLCEEIRYESELLSGAASGASRVDGASASALVLVAQELVRNAVVRGRAQLVRVELGERGGEVVLWVRDDGVGLSRAQLERATGGLENARRWVGERGGSLELEARAPAAGGTSLAVRLLPPSRSPGPSGTSSV